MYRQPRVLVDELSRALAHSRLRNVDRDEALQLHRVDQQARLRRVARAELDQLGCARDLGDAARVRLEDRALSARRVVLRQLADLFEQLGAPRVIEVLRGDLLERSREPVEHVLAQRPLGGGWDAHVNREQDAPR